MKRLIVPIGLIGVGSYLIYGHFSQKKKYEEDKKKPPLDREVIMPPRGVSLAVGAAFGISGLWLGYDLFYGK